jgi:hypothetical protein
MEDDRKLKFIGIGGYMTESNIPSTLWESDSQALVPVKFIPAIRKYVETWDMERKWNRPKGLVVSGKHSLNVMALVLKKAITRHRKVYCIPFCDIEEVCREWDSYEWLCKVDCLAMHTFPFRKFQYRDEVETSYADRIMLRRSLSNVPTIVCSPMSMSMMATHIKKTSEVFRKPISESVFLNTDVEELDVPRT